MKLVLDSDFLISAYTCDGEVRRHYQHGLELHDLAISPEIFTEVEKNLRKGEFNISPPEIKEMLSDLLNRCKLVRIEDPPAEMSTINSDWHLPALAEQIKADLILTGDNEAVARSLSCKKIRAMTISRFIEEHVGQ